MCTTKVKEPQIDGRPVLQPACNRIQSPSPLKKKIPPLTTLTPKPSQASHKVSPPISPRPKPARAAGLRQRHDINELNSSVEKPAKLAPLLRKKSKNPSTDTVSYDPLANCSSSLIVDAPGSIAAARREQLNLLQAQRKLRTSHYGRTTKGKEEKKTLPVGSSNANASQEEKRCSFITSNSDPLFIAYHDEEWGVPVHDDKILFELLVLTGAQVGSDWASILRKREGFRVALAEFDVEKVANFSEKQMVSIAGSYAINLSSIRAAVDNANRIIQIRKEFGSLGAYLWRFVSNKAISTHYRSCRKIPAKTSKSKSMSKDMVWRGFRLVGPTVVHSFMQAAGLTNDHLITCPRHAHCAALASLQSTISPTT